MRLFVYIKCVFIVEVRFIDFVCGDKQHQMSSESCQHLPASYNIHYSNYIFPYSLHILPSFFFLPRILTFFSIFVVLSVFFNLSFLINHSKFCNFAIGNRPFFLVYRFYSFPTCVYLCFFFPFLLSSFYFFASFLYNRDFVFESYIQSGSTCDVTY